MFIRHLLYHPVSGKTNNLLLFLVALVPALVLFPFPVSEFTHGIDPPLAWVFNYLVNGHCALGRHIVFPHGPLAYLMYPLPVGPGFWIALIVHILARIFMAYSLLKVATRKPTGYLALALISSFILLAVNDLLLTLIQIIILCYLNFFERRNVWWIIPALVITAFSVYIKAFVGIMSLLVTLAFAGIMVYRMIIGFESWYRLLLLLIVPFILVAVWMGLYGDLNGIWSYMRGMAYLAADNSAAVSVYPENNWWITGSALGAGLLLIIFNLKNISLGRFTILIGPALFAAWKYGIAREDYLHTSVLFVFVLFIVLVYTILSGKFRVVNAVLSFVVIALFYFTLRISYYYEPFTLRINGIQNLASKALNYRHFADTSMLATEKAIEHNKLDKNILDMIGDHTADIYPWDYSYMAANNLNWQPRPVIQSYASYTKELDQLNACHFASDKAPEFLIWELRKITHDIHGGTLESIDGRYLLNDEPETMLALLCNYDLAAVQGGIFPALVYKKRTDALKVSLKEIQVTKTGWNTWIDVPPANSDILRASVDIKRNLAGKIKSFLYKDEAVYIYYLLENGDIRMYRFIPKNASYGLWVNPLIINPENTTVEPKVSKIMFRCSNSDMMKAEVKIKWDQISLMQSKDRSMITQDTRKLVSDFFGITNKTVYKELVKSENNLEDETPYWSPPELARVSRSGKNHSLQLFPGDYSVSFEYELDSIPAKDSCELIVRTSVWAKSSRETKAVFVISIESEGKSILWKAVDVQNFTHDPRSYNFVTNFSVLSKEILLKKGLKLKVYAWNTGTNILELDDFAVRIEKR